MLRNICWCVAALVGLCTTAGAQKPVGVSGTWNVTSVVGANDSVVIIFALTIAADGKSANMKIPTQEPVPMRILALGGDSLVTEAGPYQSIVRAGETVTLLRTVAYFKDDAMWGTFEARYANGDVVKGRTEATRVSRPQ